jgi:hypothetical protein
LNDHGIYPALHMFSGLEIANGIIIWEEHPQGSAIVYNLLQRVVVFFFISFLLFVCTTIH